MPKTGENENVARVDVVDDDRDHGRAEPNAALVLICISMQRLLHRTFLLGGSPLFSMPFSSRLRWNSATN